MKKNKSGLKEETALIILEQVLLTLDFMHSRGILLNLKSLESILIDSISNYRQEYDVSIVDLS
jgi:hypothetical protein